MRMTSVVSEPNVIKPQSNSSFRKKPLGNVGPALSSSFHHAIGAKTKNTPVVEFIKAIESRPILWSMEDPQYSDSEAMEQTWEEVAQLFSCEGSSINGFIFEEQV